jgi:hypothetical protein
MDFRTKELELKRIQRSRSLTLSTIESLFHHFYILRAIGVQVSLVKLMAMTELMFKLKLHLQVGSIGSLTLVFVRA